MSTANLQSWIRQASQKKATSTPVKFLADSRGLLASFPEANSVLNRWDYGQVLPTPAIRELEKLVAAYLGNAAIEVAIQAVEKAEKAMSKWVVEVFDSEGKIQTRLNSKGETEDLIKKFATAAQADRWADLRLFDGELGGFAMISHQRLGVQTKVERADAVARILKAKLGPSCHHKSQTTDRLGFGQKVHNDSCQFSRG